MHPKLDTLLLGYLANAKEYYSEEQCEQLAKGPLQQFLILALEAISLEDMIDRNMIRHSLDQLLSDNSLEEAVLHAFLLHSYKLSAVSSHPLERGVIKQKVDGIIPIFKRAYDKGLIRKEIFERNVDALLHIADNTGELPAIHEALQKEYLKYAP